MAPKPGDQFVFEFFRRNTDSSTMVGTGNLPKNKGRVVSCDCAGVTDRNIAILLAVDQEDGNVARGRSSLWRDFRQIHVVVPASIGERNFDDRKQDGSAEPRASMKVLANAIVGNLAERRKRGLRSYSAEARLVLQGSQQLCGSHRLAKCKDASGMLLRIEPLVPAAYVLRFQESVCRREAAAIAVRTGIRKENCKTVAEEQFCIANHADSVIAQSRAGELPRYHFQRAAGSTKHVAERRRSPRS
jgi:hypothetical protein